LYSGTIAIVELFILFISVFATCHSLSGAGGLSYTVDKLTLLAVKSRTICLCDPFNLLLVAYYGFFLIMWHLFQCHWWTVTKREGSKWALLYTQVGNNIRALVYSALFVAFAASTTWAIFAPVCSTDNWYWNGVASPILNAVLALDACLLTARCVWRFLEHRAKEAAIEQTNSLEAGLLESHDRKEITKALQYRSEGNEV
jgi:hypothetical protein